MLRRLVVFLLCLPLLGLDLGCDERLPEDEEPEYQPNPTAEVCQLPLQGEWYGVMLLIEDRTAGAVCPFAEEITLVVDRDLPQGLVCPKSCVCDSDFVTSNSCNRSLRWSCGPTWLQPYTERPQSAIVTISCLFDSIESYLVSGVCDVLRIEPGKETKDCRYFYDAVAVAHELGY